MNIAISGVLGSVGVRAGQKLASWGIEDIWEADWDPRGEDTVWPDSSGVSRREAGVRSGDLEAGLERKVVVVRVFLPSPFLVTSHRLGAADRVHSLGWA